MNPHLAAMPGAPDGAPSPGLAALAASPALPPSGGLGGVPDYPLPGSGVSGLDDLHTLMQQNSEASALNFDQRLPENLPHDWAGVSFPNHRNNGGSNSDQAPPMNPDAWTQKYWG
jgi:hypothetical protein